MQNSLKNRELFYLAPIEEKITKAIEKIANQNSFTYIISQEATLFAGGEDITKLVRLELGLPEEDDNPTVNGGIQGGAAYPIGR